MSEIEETLSLRLSSKVHSSIEINRLIKDTSNIIFRRSHMPKVTVINSLMNIGWENHLLDNLTLDLIFWCLENEGEGYIENFRYTRY